MIKLTCVMGLHRPAGGTKQVTPYGQVSKKGKHIPQGSLLARCRWCDSKILKIDDKMWRKV